MTIKTYLEVDNGAAWAGQATFEVKPNIGDIIVYGPPASEAYRAKVVGFEHREQVDSFVFVIKAEKVTDRAPYDLKALVG